MAPSATLRDSGRDSGLRPERAIDWAFPARPRRASRARRAGLPLLLAASASCVPALPGGESGVARMPAGMAMIAVTEAPALAASASTPAVPVPLARDAAAKPAALAAASAGDARRARSCLAEAVYYEARSESEEGQRAVAQVVLNRVRHPAWPASVCGVVYQGPLRAGGGCQFTFTCDGSLARAPRGPAWAEARRIAGEALAGRVFAPAGHATHYHTHAVSPAWAPRLAPVGAIGAHAFYRLPGRAGIPAAFAQAYAGREPVPVPTLIPVAMRAAGRGAEAPSGVMTPFALPAALPRAVEPAAAAIPEAGTIRDAWRQSGTWRSDAPAPPPAR